VSAVPSRWCITLEGPAAPQIPVEAPHAVVSRWLDADHKAAVKPYSLAPPQSVGCRTTLEVTLLNDGLAQLLADRAAPGEAVRLGSQWFTVAAPSALEASASWTDLLRRPRCQAWEVSYLSPTTFRRGTRTSPWPAPESLVTSLASRWKALSPATVPIVNRDTARSLWVSDIDGHSETFRLRDTISSGFVGRIRYVCDGPDAGAAVNALLAFAEFAGVGSHTAFGLGKTTISATWQPSRRAVVE
jgi:CRISPR-associated endoribonuclease Cas6